jgi:hypothetical protein
MQTLAFSWGGTIMRDVIVFLAVLLLALVSLEGQTATIFSGKPALEFVSEEGTSRIVLEIDALGYPTLVFSAAHFHVIGQCYGSLIVSHPAVVFKGSGDHSSGAARTWENMKWSKDKKGRDCLVMKSGGQTDRVALAVTNAKGKNYAPIVLTGELAKLRTWFDDAVTDFDETVHRFRQLTGQLR